MYISRELPPINQLQRTPSPILHRCDCSSVADSVPWSSSKHPSNAKATSASPAETKTVSLGVSKPGNLDLIMKSSNDSGDHAGITGDLDYLCSCPSSDLAQPHDFTWLFPDSPCIRSCPNWSNPMQKPETGWQANGKELLISPNIYSFWTPTESLSQMYLLSNMALLGYLILMFRGVIQYPFWFYKNLVKTFSHLPEHERKREHWAVTLGDVLRYFDLLEMAIDHVPSSNTSGT